MLAVEKPSAKQFAIREVVGRRWYNVVSRKYPRQERPTYTTVLDYVRECLERNVAYTYLRDEASLAVDHASTVVRLRRP